MIDSRYPQCRIHPTALIEDGVVLGEGTTIWDNVHVRRNARIGRSCIVGEKTYIAYDVHVGDFCKLNANVYVCAGVTIEDNVMLSAHVVFTNDRFPRAFHMKPDGLAGSEPGEETLSTLVRRGVTVGAGAVIGPGLVLDEFAMVGMGSVVTRDVGHNGLVVGNPARMIGYVCACGLMLVRLAQWEEDAAGTSYGCRRCARVYKKEKRGITVAKDLVKGGAPAHA